MINRDKSSLLFLQLPLFVFGIFLVINIFPSYNDAYAHPIVVDSDPKQFQTIESSPSKVTIYFSESIVLQHSQIFLIDPNGKQIGGGQAEHVNDDDTTITMPLKQRLEEGSYAITTRVLSAVDGHVVDNSVVFNIGKESETTNAGNFTKIKTKDSKGLFDILSIENSAARIAGYIGQIILVGAPFAYLWTHRPFLDFNWLKNILQTNFNAIQRNLVKLLIFSNLLVVASVVAIVVIQAISIGGTIVDVFKTEFGQIIMVRLILSLVLLIFLLILYKKLNHQNFDINNRKIYSIIIGIGFGILLTNSLISHSAALGNFVPLLIDYFHSIAASIWIGGLIFLAFVFINKIKNIQNIEVKSKIVSITIDKFSVIVLPILGSIVITGPTLLWSLENNLSITLTSLYGKILILKLVLAGIMIIIGAYHQFITSKQIKQQVLIVNRLENEGEINSTEINSNSNNTNQRIDKFIKILKVEAIIGIFLLFAVSLMTNMVLPSGEISSSDNFMNSPTAIGNVNAIIDDNKLKNATNVIKETAFSTILYNDNGKIKVSLDPMSIGENKVLVNFRDYYNKPVEGIETASIKVSQIQNNIGPIRIELNKIDKATFSANIPLGTIGLWSIEVQGKSTQPNTPNTVSSFEVNVKPQPEQLEFNVTEFKTPGKSLLLYPVYHPNSDSIWIGDTRPASGKLWEFNINNNNFTAHKINDTNLITISVFDTKNDNLLWFIDPTSSILGKYNIKNDENEIIKIPIRGMISGIVTDNNQNLWMTVMQENSILKYNIDKNEFENYKIPTENARPAGLIHDEKNKAIWFTESGIGKLGRLDISTGKITEFPGQIPNNNNNTDDYNNNDNNKESLMQEPTSLLLDKETSNIYISDHLSNSIFKFNPLLSNFKKYSLPDNNDGAAFDMVFDKYDNLLIAQHISDKIAVLDPETGRTTSFNIPTIDSSVQYLTTDSNNEIWFAEQKGDALGKISSKFIPRSSPNTEPQKLVESGETMTNPKQQNYSTENANQTIMASINNIIKNTGIKFADIFGPIIVASLAVTTILFINSSNRLIINIKDMEQLEPPYPQLQKQQQQGKKKKKNQ
ncbi:MAG TPA: copper resistance protein CopC [Nitrososphaeraceae archaeon]|nr:copper resistance protein CopC [Nitrososphaeraceae archaeon]